MEKKQNNGKVSGNFSNDFLKSTEEKQQSKSHQGKFCKLIEGKHRYKSYKEACNALGIEPAKRGKAKDAQIEEIKKYYDIKFNPNNTVTLTYLKAKEKKTETKNKKYNISKYDSKNILKQIEDQKIIPFEGNYINCYNPRLFSKNKEGKYPYSDINDWLLYIAFSLNGITVNEYLYEFLKYTPIFNELLLNEKELYLTLGNDIRIYRGFYLYIIKPLKDFMLSKYKYFKKQGFIDIDKGFYGLDLNYKPTFISFSSEEYLEVEKELFKKYNLRNQRDLYHLSKAKKKKYEEFQSELKIELEFKLGLIDIKFNYYKIEPAEEYSQTQEYQNLCDRLYDKYSSFSAIRKSLILFLEIMRGKLNCNLITQVYKNRIKHMNEDALRLYLKQMRELIDTYCIFSSDIKYFDDNLKDVQSIPTYLDYLKFSKNTGYTSETLDKLESKALDKNITPLSPNLFKNLTAEDLSVNYQDFKERDKQEEETVEYLNNMDEQIEDAYEQFYQETKNKTYRTDSTMFLYKPKLLDMDDIDDLDDI